jgi:hypothetical protein
VEESELSMYPSSTAKGINEKSHYDLHALSEEEILISFN